MSKSHFEQQMEKLDHNYNHYFKFTLKTLQKEYKDHPAQLKVLLKHIEHGITKLPVFCSKKERLAVYAA